MNECHPVTNMMALEGNIKPTFCQLCMITNISPFLVYDWIALWCERFLSVSYAFTV